MIFIFMLLKNLKEIIDLQMDVAGSRLALFALFSYLENEEIIFEDKKLSVECFKVNHRIECWGFIFQGKEKSEKNRYKQVRNIKFHNHFMKIYIDGEDYVTEQKRGDKK